VPSAREDAPWHDADPWDAGWVVAASEQGGLLRRQNSRFDDGLLARLKAWRPRRPTVLVLDDPRLGDASRVINALLDGERRYRHPVRLIVVSQTLPQDLGLKSQLDGWSAGPREFIGSVLALDAAAPLSAGEVRRMFGALRLSGHVSRWKPTDDNVRRLLLRSRGNALLVCLALQQIQRRYGAEIASADELLLDRAQRIVEALEAAGFGAAEQLRAIAWATLAGGPASAIDLTAEPSPGDWPRFEPETLDAVPNLGAAWPAPAPPLVQPEPIGDAFVRLVLRRCDAATRRRVIAAAWRANPPAMLAAVRRLGQGEDALAAALRAGPPPEAALDPLDMALAYVVAAVHIPRPEWDAGEIPRLGPAVLVAARHIRALPPERAAAAFSQLVKLLEVPNAEAVLRGRAALLCIGVALRRMVQDEQSWRTPDRAGVIRAELIRLLELLPRWGTDPLRDLRSPLAQNLGGLIGCIMPAVGDPAADNWADSLAGMASRAGSAAPDSAVSTVSALARYLSERGDPTPLTTVRAHRFATMAAVRDGGDAARQAANAVEIAVLPFAGDRDFERERVRAWGCVAHAHSNDPAACERMARRVDELARPFAGDRDFELERAEALTYTRSGIRAAPDLSRGAGQLPRL